MRLPLNTDSDDNDDARPRSATSRRKHRKSSNEATTLPSYLTYYSPFADEFRRLKRAAMSVYLRNLEGVSHLFFTWKLTKSRVTHSKPHIGGQGPDRDEGSPQEVPGRFR